MKYTIEIDGIEQVEWDLPQGPETPWLEWVKKNDIVARLNRHKPTWRSWEVMWQLAEDTVEAEALDQEPEELDLTTAVVEEDEQDFDSR